MSAAVAADMVNDNAATAGWRRFLDSDQVAAVCGLLSFFATL
jgi:hypothetical protein